MKSSTWFSMITLSVVLAVTCGIPVTAQDCAIGPDLNNPYSNDVYSVYEYNGRVYDGGWYHLRRLDNGSWDSFGGGLGGGSINVQEMIEYQGDLIAAGIFSTAGGQTARNICSWDDTAFSPLGPGLNGEVYALTAWNGFLVAGGVFSATGDGATPLNAVAAWDGTSWKRVGGGFSGVPSGYPMRVEDLCVHDGQLVAVGMFQYADGSTPVNSIARWNGSAWEAFGDGLYSASVPEGLGIGMAVTSHAGLLIVSGWFGSVDGQPIPWMAAWDGSGWSSMGSEPTRHCLDLVTYDGRLYGAGPFPFTIDSVEYDMASWDGSGWTGDVIVNANWPSKMAVSGDGGTLYFGGSFSACNGQHTGLVAQWICSGALNTVGAAMNCTPDAGTLPLATGFEVTMTNHSTASARRIAGRLNVTLANGQNIPNWRAGYTTVAAGGTFATSWNTTLPAMPFLVGANSFELVVEDVTPAPYNQPPYPASGDTAQAGCTVTGIAP
jgi:hypothetical protein